MSARCNRCGGGFEGAGHGLIPLAVCRGCGREVPWFEDVGEELFVTKVLEFFRKEPVVVRAILGGVLNVLVLTGVLDTGASESVEHAVLGVVDALLVVSARSKVRPVAA